MSSIDADTESRQLRYDPFYSLIQLTSQHDEVEQVLLFWEKSISCLLGLINDYHKYRFKLTFPKLL